MNANDTPQTPDEVRERCDQFRAIFDSLKAEIGKMIVGHEEIVEGVLISLFSGGNVAEQESTEPPAKPGTES